MNATSERPRLVLAEAEIETFLQRGENLFKQQREALEAQRRTYERQRFELLAVFDRRAQALVNEREDELRQLDMAFEKQREIGERKLQAVAHLREG